MRLKGQWKQGSFDNGKWILENGNYFEGGFKNNLPFGEGKWVTSNKDNIRGEYVFQKNEKSKFEVPKVLNQIYNLKQNDMEAVWKPVYSI